RCGLPRIEARSFHAVLVESANLAAQVFDFLKRRKQRTCSAVGQKVVALSFGCRPAGRKEPRTKLFVTLCGVCEPDDKFGFARFRNVLSFKIEVLAIRGPAVAVLFLRLRSLRQGELKR